MDPGSRARPAGRLEALAERAETLLPRPPVAVEEKISLSERFGLRLSFHPSNQDDYLAIARHWVAALDDPGNGIDNGSEAEWETVRAQALQWALNRGSRSGRSAHQFARDWVGRRRLGEVD